MRPRLLDLFCCQGGASAGYVAAGFDVVGVDLAPQPRYPFKFIQADALEFVRNHGIEFDFVHASPPCQAYTDCQRIQSNWHPKLIAPIRSAIQRTGVPGVIENVPGAREELRGPVTICGTSFGLRTYRHRLFEPIGWDLVSPPHKDHVNPTVKMGRRLQEGDFYHAVGNFSNVAYVRRDLNVPWMSRDGIRECIPPAYAEYVGRQFLIQREAVQ